MPLAFADSHAHLTSDELYPQIDALVERASQANVNAIINICTDSVTLERGLQLQGRYPWIYQAAATTPHDVEKEGESQFPLIADQAKEGRLVAIGETGLDYHYAHSKPEIQKEFLRRYLHLALECRLPVIIHCRDAFTDFFEILDAEYKVNGKHAAGVLHCFTGTQAEAEQVLSRGWYLSFSGIVTFKKSLELQEVARKTPLSQLLIETDAPYLAPQSKRGKLNESAYLPEIAHMIAQLQHKTLEEVAAATSANVRNLFNLDAT